jgi:hypothetical protein
MKHCLLLVVVCLVIPRVAAAQQYYPPPPGYYPPPPGYVAPPAATDAVVQGLVLSADVGYAVPVGDLDKLPDGTTEAMSDFSSGHLPLVLGVGYRLGPMFSFGGIFQYGFAQLKSGVCPSGVSCSGRDIRIGVEVRVHFMAEQGFSPWVSGGFGYEWFTVDMSQGSLSAHATFKGFEFLNLEAGGDIRVSPGFTLGPFLGLRLQQFDSVSGTSSAGRDISQDIPSAQQAVHGWMAFGVRGAFTL